MQPPTPSPASPGAPETGATPRVAIIMGSASDYGTMRRAEEVLGSFGVPVEVRVVSAHRTPEVMFDFARGAKARGLRIIIAGAGGAAHLPGMVASLTSLPVLGVPILSRALSGVDSLLSIVQMPAGVPTATFAIGEAGAENAALFAVRMLAHDDEALAGRLDRDCVERARKSTESNETLFAKRPGSP
jgi:5-(carboxyamino)imidazole ribonucleotide mutase